MTQKSANLPARVMFNAGRTAMASGDTDEASAPASLISAVAESVPISGSIRRHIQRALASETAHLCNHADDDDDYRDIDYLPIITSAAYYGTTFGARYFGGYL